MALPYIVCFLLHVANRFSWLHPPSTLRRLVTLTHRRSPQWLQYTLAWCWPNIGLLLHVHRLLVIYMLALQVLPPNAAMMSVSRNAHRPKFVGIVYKLSASNHVKLIPHIIYKFLLMTFESYDLRAVVLVAFFLDGPVWHAFWQSLGILNVLECVICTEAVTIFTQALLASLRRHHGHFLIAQNRSTMSVGAEEPKGSSSRSLPRKKIN